MELWQVLNVFAATVGVIILLVMAVIPFLTEEGGPLLRRHSAGRGRHVLGPPPHPPR